MHTRSSPNRQTLNRLAAEAGIANYETMPKAELFKRLSEDYNLDRLMRIEARKQRIQESLKSTKKRKAEGETEDEEEDSPGNSSSSAAPSNDEKGKSRPAKKVKLNTLDPIMFIPIAKNKKTFKFTRPNGSIVQFNVDSLIDFMITSGDFQDPETRLPFSDEQLKEIDAIAKENGLVKTSVFDAKRNVQFYSDAKFRRDALLGLERCAGEVIADILELIEEGDPDDAQMQLAMQEFPSFVDYFRQIRDADAEYAAKCISHWKAFIAGPPNHPNEDEFGLLKLVLKFLKNCEDGRF